ncbi:hypothetical protein FHE72_23390 (plasmid) [Rossellomorea vietnamensis]|uniref:Uncharacterized protein n=1 Tax=Rossellomorea vietnamensis TaxID=218284 RepID=A0A6I6UPS2_9BACI|nr:hypothetical protein [Rossellomorea vietnamensis]QHE63938.1 hypothetical protein FHE72_23390 [Rossellomorea vietnamensis]
MKSQNLENAEDNITLICQALDIPTPNFQDGKLYLDDFLNTLIERGVITMEQIGPVIKKRTSL